MNTIELWDRLLQAGLVQGAAPEAPAGRSPWFVRVMLGVAGWFGALFLLIFVGLGLSFIIKNAGAALVVGVVACGFASALFRKLPENDFAGQFAFAVSLAGQALIVFGIADTIGSKSVAVIGGHPAGGTPATSARRPRAAWPAPTARRTNGARARSRPPRSSP